MPPKNSVCQSGNNLPEKEINDLPEKENCRLFLFFSSLSLGGNRLRRCQVFTHKPYNTDSPKRGSIKMNLCSQPPGTRNKIKKHSLKPQIFLQLELSAPEGKTVDPSSIPVLDSCQGLSTSENQQLTTHIRVEHCNGLLPEVSIGQDGPIDFGDSYEDEKKEEPEVELPPMPPLATSSEKERTITSFRTSMVKVLGRHDHLLEPIPTPTSSNSPLSPSTLPAPFRASVVQVLGRHDHLLEPLPTPTSSGRPLFSLSVPTTPSTRSDKRLSSLSPETASMSASVDVSLADLDLFSLVDEKAIARTKKKGFRRTKSSPGLSQRKMRETNEDPDSVKSARKRSSRRRAMGLDLVPDDPSTTSSSRSSRRQRPPVGHEQGSKIRRSGSDISLDMSTEQESNKNEEFIVALPIPSSMSLHSPTDLITKSSGRSRRAMGLDLIPNDPSTRTSSRSSRGQRPSAGLEQGSKLRRSRSDFSVDKFIQQDFITNEDFIPSKSKKKGFRRIHSNPGLSQRKVVETNEDPDSVKSACTRASMRRRAMGLDLIPNDPSIRSSSGGGSRRQRPPIGHEQGSKIRSSGSDISVDMSTEQESNKNEEFVVALPIPSMSLHSPADLITRSSGRRRAMGLDLIPTVPSTRSSGRRRAMGLDLIPNEASTRSSPGGGSRRRRPSVGSDQGSKIRRSRSDISVDKSTKRESNKNEEFIVAIPIRSRYLHYTRRSETGSSRMSSAYKSADDLCSIDEVTSLFSKLIE
jgi:hypothetical protein